MPGTDTLSQNMVCAGILPSLTVSTPRRGRSWSGARKPVAAITSSQSKTSGPSHDVPRAWTRKPSAMRSTRSIDASTIDVPKPPRTCSSRGWRYRVRSGEWPSTSVRIARGDASTMRFAHGSRLFAISKAELRLPTMNTLRPSYSVGALARRRSARRARARGSVPSTASSRRRRTRRHGTCTHRRSSRARTRRPSTCVDSQRQWYRTRRPARSTKSASPASISARDGTS